LGKRELPPTIRGYNAYEVVSAFQKAIRRSQVDDAVYWGAELYQSGYGNWAWKRLKIIVSEDIGPAAPGLPADFWALYQMAGGKPEAGKGQLMFFVHAVILAARAPKCRVVDWALFSTANVRRDPDRDIPDEALDMHTIRGKQMGRGAGHFVKEAGKLVQPDGVAPEETVPAELRKLEEEYRKVFCEDQSRWVDPDPDLEPDDKPKQKQEQKRLLP